MRLPVLIPTILLLPLSLGFSFTLNSTAVSQCGVTSVHWSGGTPPFYLTVIVGLHFARLYLLLSTSSPPPCLASSSRSALAPSSRCDDWVREDLWPEKTQADLDAARI